MPLPLRAWALAVPSGVKDNVASSIAYPAAVSRPGVRLITAWPADRRAREIAHKIREAAKDPKINAKSLTVEAGAQAARILADGKRIMFVLDQDAALEELERNLLVEVYRAQFGRRSRPTAATGVRNRWGWRCSKY